MVKVYIERDNKDVELDYENPVSVKVVLKKLNISSESVILVKNGNICLDDELVSKDDELKLLSVVSGG